MPPKRKGSANTLEDSSSSLPAVENDSLKKTKKTKKDKSNSNGSETLVPKDADFRIPVFKSALDVQPSIHLLSQPNVSINLDLSPDGLPFVLKVNRSSALLNAIKVNLEMDEREIQNILGSEFLEGISSSQRAADDASTKVGINGAYFTSSILAKNLVGDTILSRILSGKSPRKPKSSQRSYVDYSPLYAPASPMYSPTSPAYAPASPAYAPVRSNSLSRRGRGGQRETDSSGRSTWLSKQMYDVKIAVALSEETSSKLFTYRGETFEEAKKEEFFREDIKFIGGQMSIKNNLFTNSPSHAAILVDNRKILLGFASLCHFVEHEYHSKRVMHGDLSPSNILITSDSFIAIDGMEVPFDTVAPGGTIEWAAPEQLMYTPVSAKTDVYSIALMVIALLGGLIFGELSEHAIALRNKPTEAYRLETVKLILNPNLVFPVDIDFHDVLLDCIQGDQSRRPTLKKLSVELVAAAEKLSDVQVVNSLSRGFGDGRGLYLSSSNEYFWSSSETLKLASLKK